MIAIIDYGMGNLRSVQKAIERLGGDGRIVAAPADVTAADKIVLPGVAAFGDAIERLRAKQLDEPIRQAIEAGIPYLGFCLGLQLLFEVSYEYGEHRGLGVFGGEVRRFEFAPGDEAPRVPHIGWNQVWRQRPCPMLHDVPDGEYFYFDHSYHVVPTDESIVAATTDHGGRFVSAVWKDNVFATQFHPEKSQSAGLKILASFVGM
jgi:glutamine amidotransferase